MEQGYLDLLRHILRHGTDKTDRTGVGTRSIFGAQLRFDLTKGFPLITTKKLYTKGIFGELCWLMRGETNTKYLVDNNIHIWDEWADENGDLGPIYGQQWRRWRTESTWTTPIDQLQEALDTIKTNPDSRRIIVTAWNPLDIPNSALPPCHMMFQFEVHDGKLSCHMYQRSADMFLGVPFNIASYAALTHVMAAMSDLEVGDLIISFGDAHIYNNHFGQVEEQLMRTPYPSPILELSNVGPDSTFESIEIEDFVLLSYKSHPAIKAEVAV